MSHSRHEVLADGHNLYERGSGVCWGLESIPPPKSHLWTQELGLSRQADDTNWAVSACAEADLGDVRRTTRLVERVGVLAQHPTAACPDARAPQDLLASHPSRSDAA